MLCLIGNVMNIEYDKSLVLDLENEKASEELAERLAHCLSAPAIITFSGEIGTGKTTIIRAMLKRMGIRSAIKSPTFSLVESYQCMNFNVHHFDLYRIHQEDELEYIGFRDYFSDANVCCIEWAEHAGKALPNIDIRFKLSIKGAGRTMHIDALSDAGERILACLAGG